MATAQAVEVRSDKGYLFRVATDALFPEGALIPAVFLFLNADCSGTPYLRVRRPADVISPSTVHPWMLNQGIVLGAPPSYPSTEYYAPAGAQVLENVASVHAHLPDPFGCVPLDTPQNLVELLPNDPSVTGVSHGLSGKVTIAP